MRQVITGVAFITILLSIGSVSQGNYPTRGRGTELSHADFGLAFLGQNAGRWTPLTRRIGPGTSNGILRKYGRGLGRGILGTVREAGPRYFIMDLDNGGYLKIICTENTLFQLHGAKTDGTHVKPGARVRVTGTTVDGSTVEAYKVNVVREADKSQS